MTQSKKMMQPPRMLGPEGKPRRVGVELEFAAISAHHGAKLVQSLFGGTIREEDPHRFYVSATQYGEFVCELDSQYVHAAADDEQWETVSEGAKELLIKFRAEFRRLLGDISAYVVPCEIACPPITLEDLPAVETLVAALRDAGASSTRENPLYAFGAQLNPDIASTDASYLTAMLKAYLLLSDWLRAVINMDTTRRITAFADPFPKPYVMQVLDPDYAPDLPTLIDDYLAANPTRNRELDMLPLFSYLDPERVRAAIDNPLIKPRPTFHYRLPDSRLSEPGWGMLLEWNRWCLVEKLAERPELMAEMSKAYCTHYQSVFAGSWAVPASEWLLLS